MFFLSGSVQFFLFTLLVLVSLLISSLWRGQWWGIFRLCCCCLFSAIFYCLGIQPGKSRHCVCMGEWYCPVRAVWGRGAASSLCTRMIDISQTLSLALIGCIEPGVMDSCKSNYSHWVKPQTVDFYTAVLYLILLSDHDDNFSKYNKKIVTDYSFKTELFTFGQTRLVSGHKWNLTATKQECTDVVRNYQFQCSALMQRLHHRKPPPLSCKPLPAVDLRNQHQYSAKWLSHSNSSLRWPGERQERRWPS